MFRLIGLLLLTIVPISAMDMPYLLTSQATFFSTTPESKGVIPEITQLRKNINIVTDKQRNAENQMLIAFGICGMSLSSLLILAVVNPQVLKFYKVNLLTHNSKLLKISIFTLMYGFLQAVRHEMLVHEILQSERNFFTQCQQHYVGHNNLNDVLQKKI